MNRQHAGSPARRPTMPTLAGGRARAAAFVRLARAARLPSQLAVGLLAAVGAFFVVIDQTTLVNLFARPLLHERSSEASAEVAVILAGGRYADDTLNQPSIERTIAGVRLYHQRRAPYLLFSGGPCCGRSTAALMGQLAHELGVPRDAILLEEQSVRTYDGVLYSAELIRRHGFASVILVTSTVHLPRARRTFAAAGVAVATVRASETDLALVSGTDERLALLGDAVHEYVGLAYYRLKGWL